MDEETISTILADSSAKFINENKLCTGKFEWQQTCSAFAVSKVDVDKVCKYILNQPEHHRKKTFQQEYDAFIEYYQETIIPNKTKHDMLTHDLVNDNK